MRLRELIRRERDERPLPEDVRAELEALDRALAGEPVPDQMEGLAELVADLRAERPEPDATFADRLDRWAASGFDRQRKPGLGRQAAEAGGAAGRRFRVDLRAPWVPAAATACLLAVVVASAVLVSPLGERDDEDAGGGGVVSEIAAPAEEDAGARQAPGAAGPAAIDAVETRARAGQGISPGGVDPALPTAPDPRSGAAANVEERRVERDAHLVLGAPADKAQDVTNEVVAVVEAHDGIVLNSRVSSDEAGASAVLQLQIPTRNLDAALDELSGLADVRSFSEGSTDITAPFVSARDRMRDLRAERRSLLAQIEAATDPTELDELKERLAGVNRRLARAEAAFSRVKHRAQQSRVTLQITSDGAEEGGWSLEDALDDAGRVLTVVAGVALIAAAALLPLALIAAIAFFVLRAARGRAREGALDD
ncbi:MAG TPA: DUF4349 domain-containing protein [Solirubrobacterales bacterium]|jgi:hypothetical protein